MKVTRTFRRIEPSERDTPHEKRSFCHNKIMVFLMTLNLLIKQTFGKARNGTDPNARREWHRAATMVGAASTRFGNSVN